MKKDDQIISGLRDIYNKQVWLNKAKMEVALHEYKSSEVHFIEYIGNHGECNVTKLADSFYMTRGAISKLSKKLMSKGVIESYQKEENRKEIYFKLTKKGKQVFQIHEALHKEFQKRDSEVFEHMSEEQLISLLTFVNSYNQHLDKEINKEKRVRKDVL